MSTILQEKPRQLPMHNQRFEQVFHQNFRHCDCEMPMISKKWNDALGTFVAIRLCCMAKALEELTGKTLYEVYEFDPKWEWDCEGLHQCEDMISGTTTYVQRGKPPKWLLERMQKKGIEVKNLPEDRLISTSTISRSCTPIP